MRKNPALKLFISEYLIEMMKIKNRNAALKLFVSEYLIEMMKMKNKEEEYEN